MTIITLEQPTQAFDSIVDRLRQGEIVCIPTETVYGLAVDASNPEAVLRLYKLKGNLDSKPIAVAIQAAADAYRYMLEPEDEHVMKIMNAFWPGPLSLLLKAHTSVPDYINKGNGKIGLRCPYCPIAQAILRGLGQPLCLTSANMAGGQDGLIAKDIDALFQKKILILEKDEQIGGKPSTIIDLSTEPYQIIRHGAIPLDALTPYGVVR